MIGRFVSSLPFLLGFVIVIWVVELVNGFMDHQLNEWGIFLARYMAWLEFL